MRVRNGLDLERMLHSSVGNTCCLLFDVAFNHGFLESILSKAKDSANGIVLCKKFYHLSFSKAFKKIENATDSS